MTVDDKCGREWVTGEITDETHYCGLPFGHGEWPTRPARHVCGACEDDHYDDGAGVPMSDTQPHSRRAPARRDDPSGGDLNELERDAAYAEATLDGSHGYDLDARFYELTEPPPADLGAGEWWCVARSLRGSALEVRCTRPEGHEGNHAAHGTADDGRTVVVRQWDPTNEGERA